MTGIRWWMGATRSFAAQVHDGAGIEVVVVCSFRRPDAGERHGYFVLAVEPDRGPAARLIFPPLIESAGRNQAAALPERLPE